MVSVGESFNLPHYLCSAFLKHTLLRTKLINDCWICKLQEVWAHKNLDNKVGGKKEIICWSKPMLTGSVLENKKMSLSPVKHYSFSLPVSMA